MELGQEIKIKQLGHCLALRPCKAFLNTFSTIITKVIKNKKRCLKQPFKRVIIKHIQ